MVYKEGMQNAVVMNDELWSCCYRMVHQLSLAGGGGGDDGT